MVKPSTALPVPPQGAHFAMSERNTKVTLGLPVRLDGELSVAPAAVMRSAVYDGASEQSVGF